MPKFIQTDRVPVRDDAGNTVWLRRKMDLGAISRVSTAREGNGLTALYAANILAWDGPDFKGIKCTPEEIEKIDPDDPFWEQVADKIAELNPRKGVDGPLSATTPSESDLPASDTEPSTNGTHTSRSPSTTAGHRSK